MRFTRLNFNKLLASPRQARTLQNDPEISTGNVCKIQATTADDTSRHFLVHSAIARTPFIIVAIDENSKYGTSESTVLLRV